MPYIETTSNVSIPGRKEQVIKDRMGDAIEKIPGKTESWLMLSFRDNAAMYFKGTDAPCAICQVKLFGGSATEEDYAALTEALTGWLCRRKGIDPSDAALIPMEEYRRQQFDILADGVRGALDMDAVYAAMGMEKR